MKLSEVLYDWGTEAGRALLPRTPFLPEKTRRSVEGRRDLLERQAPPPDSSQRHFVDLHAALEKLPEKHRLPLMLFYFDGKSSEKLAEELKLSRAGACTRLFRARNELRKILEYGKTSESVSTPVTMAPCFFAQ